MKHLKLFLSRLQTLPLRPVQNLLVSSQNRQSADQDAGYATTPGQQAHGAIEKELSLLRELALIDVMALPQNRLSLLLEELHTVKERLSHFWIQYHNLYPEQGQPIPNTFWSQLELQQPFVVGGQQPEPMQYENTEQFVEELGESVRLNEVCLQQFIEKTQRLLLLELAQKGTREKLPPRPANTSKRSPVLVEGVAKVLFDLLKNYFSATDQRKLQSLLLQDIPPATPLLFQGNGNQLADAFKQLYEANLIVGCQKADLEAWIAQHFQYVYRGQKKQLTSNYLNALISSDAKPCQSPILDVKRLSAGTPTIVPSFRTKKHLTTYR